MDRSLVDAVAFDLDGTLIDTEKYYFRAWPQALRHFGYEADAELALSLRSLGRPFAPLYLRQVFGEDFDYDAVRAYRIELVKSMIEKEGLELKSGAAEILSWLRKQGIRTAVVTANGPERTESLLASVSLSGCFDDIVCATMVSRGKPEPDVYTYACQRLKLAPDRVFAVEDSPNGVESAYRAGCRVIMIPDLTEPDERTAPMLYARLDSLWDIAGLWGDTV